MDPVSPAPTDTQGSTSRSNTIGVTPYHTIQNCDDRGVGKTQNLSYTHIMWCSRLLHNKMRGDDIEVVFSRCYGLTIPSVTSKLYRYPVIFSCREDGAVDVFAQANKPRTSHGFRECRS
eukprot:scaffold10009_cov105-Cylindrotheca_fusiformis.AAC.5